MFCCLWDAPCRVDRKCGTRGVVFFVDWMDRGDHVAEGCPDVGERLSAKGRNHRDGSVVAGYFENNPGSYGAAHRSVTGGRGGDVRSR